MSGEPRELCGAQRQKQDLGVLCGLRAGYGTDHPGVGRCKFHAGSTPSSRKHALMLLARREVEALVAERKVSAGEVERVGPAQALLDALWCAHEDLALYRRLVDELLIPADGVGGGAAGVDGVLFGPLQHLSGTPTGEAARHVLVKMYEDAQARVAAIAARCLRARVQEQEVEASRRRAEAHVLFAQAFAQRLGMNPLDPAVRTAMREALMVAGAQHKDTPSLSNGNGAQKPIAS